MESLTNWCCRRKLTARIAELEDTAEQARSRAAKLEKDKSKLQLEIRDLTIQLEAVSPKLQLIIAKLRVQQNTNF